MVLKTVFRYASLIRFFFRLQRSHLPIQFLICIVVCNGVASRSAISSPYFEFATGLGSATNADQFFNTTHANPTQLGFSGALNFYFPITPMRHFAHLELGVQNRLLFVSSDDHLLADKTNVLFSPSAALRVEFWRMFIGAGISPTNLASKSGKGLGSLAAATGFSSHFFEGGVIWRVVPEFQICLAVSTEQITGPSHASTLEYGLRFRFPTSPSEQASSGGVDWDGFRYPFGIMR